MSDAPGTITKEKLSKLTGIPVARLRQLAADGFFSKAVDGSYKLTDAIQGLFKYYRETSQQLPVFDSIDACVGATGIPRHVIKSAKKLGCSAFSSNRVNLGKLLPFLFGKEIKGGSSSTSMTIDDWKQRKVEEEVLSMECSRKIREERLIPVETLRGWFAPALLDVRNTLLSIPGKLAAQVPGMEPAAAEAAMRDAINDALRQISSHPWEDDEPRSKDNRADS